MSQPEDQIIKQYQKEVSSDTGGLSDVLKNAGNWQVPEERSQAEVWAALEEQMNAKAPVQHNSNSSVWKMAIAACLILAIGVTFYLIYPRMTVVQTGAGTTEMVELPDGSKVTLNAQSTLEYLAKDFRENRSLKLQGEAYFEVKPGSPFNVSIDEMNVEVLGTSFNIYAREEQKEVKCLTGKVKVSIGADHLFLSKGEGVVSSGDVLLKETDSFDADDVVGWMDGKFEFNEVLLSKVIKELEIQYGVEVRNAPKEERYYSGYFELGDVEQAARQVLVPMDVTYIISEGQIIIK